MTIATTPSGLLHCSRFAGPSVFLSRRPVTLSLTPFPSSGRNEHYNTNRNRPSPRTSNKRLSNSLLPLSRLSNSYSNDSDDSNHPNHSSDRFKYNFTLEHHN